MKGGKKGREEVRYGTRKNEGRGKMNCAVGGGENESQ